MLFTLTKWHNIPKEKYYAKGLWKKEKNAEDAEHSITNFTVRYLKAETVSLPTSGNWLLTALMI